MVEQWFANVKVGDPVIIMLSYDSKKQHAHIQAIGSKYITVDGYRFYKTNGTYAGGYSAGGYSHCIRTLAQQEWLDRQQEMLKELDSKLHIEIKHRGRERVIEIYEAVKHLLDAPEKS